MTDYTTKEEVKQRLSGDVPTMSASWDDELDSLISQVSAEFDREIAAARGLRDGSWSFVADLAATDRRFNRKYRSQYLPIDDCVDVASVTDGTLALVEGTDYEVDPLTMLPVVALYRTNGHWTEDRGGITVSAKWGYATAVPADVNKACTTETIRAYFGARAGEDDRIGMTPFGTVVTARAFTDTTRVTLRTYGQGGGFMR